MTLRSPPRVLVAGVTALTAALLLLSCGGDDNPPGATVGSSTTAAAPITTREDHNDADVTFLRTMISHHAQAVELSDIILDKDDVDENVGVLAQQVTEARQSEIDRMTDWLEAWDEDVRGISMDPDVVNGMLSVEEVDAIGAATGGDAARLYLRSLLAHHEGAVHIARVQVGGGMNAEVVRLAERIMDMHQAEIAEVEGLLTVI